MVRTVSALKASVLAALLLCDGHLSAACEGVAVQVLGSGGREIGDKRASSAYLVWENGLARALIDEAGVTDHLWSLEEIAQLADRYPRPS